MLILVQLSEWNNKVQPQSFPNQASLSRFLKGNGARGLVTALGMTVNNVYNLEFGRQYTLARKGEPIDRLFFLAA